MCRVIEPKAEKFGFRVHRNRAQQADDGVAPGMRKKLRSVLPSGTVIARLLTEK